MPWHTIVHTDHPIIETCYAGILTKFDLTDAVHETLALAKTHSRTLFLGDCTTLKGGHSIFDLYALAKEISLSNASSPLKEAILLPSISTFIEKINFWETLGINRGFKVRVFRDRDTAIEWLIG